MSEATPSEFLASTPEGLFEFSLDPQTGNVLASSVTPFRHRLSYLALSPKGDRVYACGEGEADSQGNTGRVWSWERPGTLSELIEKSSSGSGGVTPCFLALHPFAPALAVANFRGAGARDSAGSVALLALSGEGELRQILDRRSFPGSSAHSTRQTASHPHSVAFTANPDTLLVADLGTDSLWSLEVLREKGGELYFDDPARHRMHPGSGPRHLYVVLNGHAIFLNTEMGNDLIWLHPMDGVNVPEGFPRFRHVLRRPLLPPGVESAAAADLQCSPDFRNIYATLRGPDLIVGFRVEVEEQLIRSIPPIESGGKNPRALAVSRDGSFVVCANSGDKATVFFRDSRTGILSPTGSELPVCHHVVALG